MGIKVNIGGERLGSGSKMMTSLSNYGRSTHNLTETFTSSLAPGVLYPFLVKPALLGDTFDIDLDADVVTLPTQGPLYGSFKCQLDLFVVPMRLYIGILHNNPKRIGMKMNQVFFPKMRIEDIGTAASSNNENQFANNSLVKYLGISGLGRLINSSSPKYYRDFNAIPMLAYYDIFATYYSNKSEKKAWVLTPDDVVNAENSIMSYELWNGHQKLDNGEFEGEVVTEYQFNLYNGYLLKLWTKTPTKYSDWSGIEVNSFYCGKEENGLYVNVFKVSSDMGNTNVGLKTQVTHYAKPTLLPFDLTNIDDMRYRLLSANQLGQEHVLKKDNVDLPYVTNLKRTAENNNRFSNNRYPLNGLVVKTYQSDMFNSFIDTEYIDGENGIAALTAIDVSSGSFTMDALNLQEKLYNVLNRIAVSGGTYEDWLEAVYSTRVIRKAESPIYCGGLSKEIAFQQITQTTPTENDPLGTLGGLGKFTPKHKGGHVIIRVNEPSFIIGIASLTPRIRYSQGNEFYMTEFKTMDDLHKPGLDGIGYEPLIGERMAWFDTTLKPKDPANPQNGYDIIRNSYGKLPAWIDYMTSVDKVYGDFANQGGKSFMVLSRQYELETDISGYGHIADFTSYIDPAKYNYAFANAELTAQNFWMEIKSSITARRVMSAKIIPNL